MAWNVPSVFTALSVLTAAKLNQIRDSLNAIGDSWTAYTPTLGNWTKNSGTRTASARMPMIAIHVRRARSTRGVEAHSVRRRLLDTKA